MCLSSPWIGIHYVNDQAVAKLESSINENPHAGVGCNNIQCAYIKLEGGGVLTLHNMPVNIPQTGGKDEIRMVMYPIDESHTEYSVPTVPLPCMATYFEAWMSPELYVPMMTKQIGGPRYRSLSDGGEGSKMDIAIPEKPCIVNSDGSYQFFVMLSKMQPPLPSSTTLQAMPVEERLKLQTDICKVIVDQLSGQLVNQGINPSYLFPWNEEMGDVDPSAYIAFKEQLLMSMIPGTDIFVCLPPLKKEDDGVTVPNWGNDGNAAFRMAFHFPNNSNPSKFPLPGLNHNLDPGQEVNGETEVTDHYYIYMNMEGGMDARVLCSGSAPEDTARNIKLHNSQEYRTTGVPPGYEWCLPGFVDRPGLPKQILDPVVDQASHEMVWGADYEAYLVTCQTFQSEVADKINAKINQVIFEMNKHNGMSLRNAENPTTRRQNGYHDYMEYGATSEVGMSCVNIKTTKLHPQSTCIAIPGLFASMSSDVPYKRPRN